MDNIKHHRLRLKEMTGPVDFLEEELKKLKGVRKVEIDRDRKEVFVEYDLLKCREVDIERKIQAAGFSLDDRWSERLRRGWIHFTEENEEAALRAEGAPCCDIEKVERKKKILDD